MTNGLNESVESDVHPAGEADFELDNDDESKNSEQTEHDQFKSQINRNTRQPVYSLQDPNFGSFFRGKISDTQPNSYVATPVRVCFNRSVNVRPISPKESTYYPRTGKKTKSMHEIMALVFIDKSISRTTKKFQTEERMALAK